MSQGYNSGSSTINGDVLVGQQPTIPTTQVFGSSGLSAEVPVGKKWNVVFLSVFSASASICYWDLDGEKVLATALANTTASMNCLIAMSAGQVLTALGNDVDTWVVSYYEEDA